MRVAISGLTSSNQDLRPPEQRGPVGLCIVATTTDRPLLAVSGSSQELSYNFGY